MSILQTFENTMIYIIDKDVDTKGWYYCQETNEIYYHDGRSIRDSIPTTELFVGKELTEFILEENI